VSTESITTFIVASTLLSLAPGPDNLFVLTQSALHGRKAGMLITLGLCTGLVVHTSAVALGVAAVFMVSLTAFTLLKLVGAGYLLWLAWQAFRTSAGSLGQGASPALPDGAALYRRGILMNLTNPKVAIFFLAFLPQFADPAAGSLTGQLFVLGLLFIAVALVVFFGIAGLAGFISTWLKDSHRAQIMLNRIAGLVFVGLALRLATATR